MSAVIMLGEKVNVVIWVGEMAIVRAFIMVGECDCERCYFGE